MKQKLFVPVMGSVFHQYPEQTLRDLKAAGADQVFYACGFPYALGEKERMLTWAKTDLPRLKAEGFEPCVWINAFGFGGPLSEESRQLLPFQKITAPNGKTLDSAFCPTDPAFTEYYCKFVQELLQAGAETILLDDDLCLNVRPGLGCACDGHLRRLREELKEEISREEIYEKVFTGEANRYRRAWAKVMGDSLKEFCITLRKAVDEINPSARMGFCSGYTSWDLEGADALELTDLLAGKNKPLLRYSAAPYWEYTRRFPWEPEGHIVEFCRQQIQWSRHRADVELFTENDTYPRPRTNVPAFAAESFDFMTSADSAPNQLKYLFDYVSSPDYERGYLNAHLQNRDLIRTVGERLGSLPAAGVYVHDTMRKFTEISLPTPFCGEKQVMRSVSFSAASALLSANGIPVTYEDHGGVTAAFGDGGRTVPLHQKAYILDLPAALELQKREIDVGLISAVPASRGGTEYFRKPADFIRISDRTEEGFVRAELSPKAKVESEFSPGMPSSYRYVNGRGMKFLVLLFRGDFVCSSQEIAASYYRQEQIADFCREGGSLPVFCPKHPKLHLICKETEEVLAMAYCNYGNDPIEEPFFETAVPLGDGETFGCEGTPEQGGVRLAGIPARSFGAFRYLKK